MSGWRPCSLGSLGGCQGKQEAKDAFSEEDWLCLKARSGISKIRRVCDNHAAIFLKYFPLKQSYCCDPQNKHSKRVQGAHSITIREYKASKAASVILPRPLVPGKKLCKGCSSNIVPLLGIFPEIEDPTTSSFSSTSHGSSRNGSQSNPQTPHPSPTIILVEGRNRLAELRPPMPEDSPPNRGNVSTSDQVPQGQARSIMTAQITRPSLEHPVIPAASDDHTSATVDDQNQLEPLLESQEGVADDESEPTSTEPSQNPDDDAFYPPDVALAMVDASLEALEESPINKRKLKCAPTYGPKKINKTETKIEKLMVQGGVKISNKKEDFYDKTILALLEKYKCCSSKEEKMAVLSVALVGLSQATVLEKFGPLGATEFLVRKTVQLTKERGLFPKPLPKKGRSLPDDTTKLVVQHYESDQYSRQLPGKKDYVIVIKDEQKLYVQKRLVLCNLNELYQKFKTLHPSVQVGFSKFASLRPRHCIFAGAVGTHAVCVCKYHQNAKLMIEAVDMKSLDPSLETFKDLIAIGLCTPPSSDCFLQSCQECPGFDLLEEHLTDMLQQNCIEEITFKQWGAVDRNTLEVHTLDLGSFLETLKDKLQRLAPHHFITKQQGQYLQDVKDDLQHGETLTICDFSENYTFIMQDSIQGYYFRNDQATLHPFVTYYKLGEELKVLSFVVISDCRKHDVNSFYAFQKNHVQHLKENVPNLKKITYFSDGASSQYKNAFNMINVSHHEIDFGVQCEWNFFATSHGKGPSDGVGGTIKRSAARASIQGTLIRTPLEMFKWAKEAMPTMTVSYVSTEDVQNVKTALSERFKEAIQLTNIMNYHRIVPLSVAEVECRRYSNSDETVYAPVQLLRKAPQLSNLTVGCFVAVKVKVSSWNLCQVIQVNESTNDVIASYLKKAPKSGSSNSKYQLPSSTEKQVSISLASIVAVVTMKADSQNQMLLSISADESRRVSWQLKSMK